uniref:Rho termination factor, N-terminal domain, F-box domain and Ankyrin repeat protein n=1 Tax=Pithovirus LCPAC304 TaxID=2506594 RepID=A0A481Z9I8_9VIRU|nr:MAG: Rho termination factor, N-terminal domain, F-box domain and Ankyrin repeat protein [Pithovirus LCPAC304]
MEDPLTALTIKELRAIARQYNVKGRSKPKTKSDLVAFLRKNLTADQIKKSVGGKKSIAKTRKSEMELFDLPKEVIWETLFDLLPKDVLQFCATHRRADTIICQNDDFWAQKIQRDFEGVYETSSIPIGTRFETYKKYWDNAQERFFPCLDEGHTECVKSLLRLGVDPNSQTPEGVRSRLRLEGVTALMWASEKGHADIARLLLEHGAKPNIQEEHGFTTLIVAIYNGSADIVQLLLERGANPNIHAENALTPLILASELRQTDIVRVLLEHGVDPNIQGRFGWTALMKAASTGKRVDRVQLLLEHDANPDIENDWGDTALSLASSRGHTDIVRLLSER